MPGPVAHRLTHLIAHRGNARDYPENTLPALQSAVDLGVRFLEFDVQLSADEVPVVIHDHELARTAGIPGVVFDLTATELARTEVNEPQRFGGRHRGTRIPLLSEVVSFIAERREITAFVEIKRASLRRFGHEIVVPKVLEALKPVRSRCVVISFDLPAVHMARQRDGQAIGWVLSEYDGHTRLKYEAFKPEYLFCNHEKLPGDAPRLWRGPWRWAIYEVDTPELALSLAERGADFIETMAVAPMIQAFRDLAARSGKRGDAPL
ncbi:MAG TPA: glycerophosphodiester phosphodiesterase family protein [Steroidobacteraceae bacterium]|nr:glycerophosphodiester phosphodiesterase family protein [Steroidobacteraceae bacterium]